MTRPLKILHVGKYFSPFRGGLENYLRDLMVALAERGIWSAALVHRHTCSFRGDSDTLRLDGRDFRVVRAATWAKLLFTPISPSFPWCMWHMIRELQPDILHLHMPNPSAFWALVLPSARNIPWVVHWHADVITEQQGLLMKLAYACYRPFERAVLRHSVAIIATSPRYRDSSDPLRPWLAKCRVVPLGLDPGQLPETEMKEEASTLPCDPTVSGAAPPLQVLAVGRLTYYKGFHFLIQAVDCVEDVHVDLVGDGEQANELKQLVASLGLQKRVVLHGTTDDHELALLLARCDCLCLPSIERTEAFGMVLLEAMSFGKATVVSDVPGSGMGWVVDHGVTGLKVPPADPEALAEAFRQLATDRSGLRAMGQAGRQKFKRLFEINHAVEGVVDTYHDVLANRARAEGVSGG